MSIEEHTNESKGSEDDKLFSGPGPTDNSAYHLSPKSAQESTIQDYQLKRLLGEGSYATVRLAVHTPTNKTYACKIYKMQNLTEQKKMRNV